MKRLFLTVPVALLLLAAPASAVDHNNIDAGRPLSFDDAEAIAFREFAVETGLGLGWPRRRPLGLGAELEMLYGFALNSHVSLGFDPSIGGRSEGASTAFSFGDVRLGAQHNFNREYGNTPAFSLRGDVFFPTGRGSQGTAFRMRGIMSKQARQFDRFHLNLDLNGNPGAAPGEREFNPGVILGYTRPVGYPTHFSSTGLAEVGVQAGPDKGTGPLVTVGVGLRRQVGVRSVVDVGLQSDVVGANGAPRDRIRFILGYSAGF